MEIDSAQCAILTVVLVDEDRCVNLVRIPPDTLTVDLISKLVDILRLSKSGSYMKNIYLEMF